MVPAGIGGSRVIATGELTARKTDLLTRIDRLTNTGLVAVSR
jgi:hypothetical protein